MNGLLIVSLTVGLWAPPPQADMMNPSSEESSNTLDPRFMAPPEPDRTGPNWIIATGGALITAGLVGMVASKGCVTRDERGRCVDPYGGHTLYPSLVVLGFGTAMSGAYWWRQQDVAPDPIQPTPF